MPDVIHLQFARSPTGGETIRKWSREPFAGGEPYALQSEYICKCGQRVEPHRCRDTKGEW